MFKMSNLLGLFVIFLSFLCIKGRDFYTDEELLDKYAEDAGKSKTYLERNGLETRYSKRGIGGIKLLRAALIAAGVTHASSLLITTGKIAFDIWFEQNKCCQPNPSICTDFDEYKTLRTYVLAKADEIGVEWNTVKNRETYLFSLSRKHHELLRAVEVFDDRMQKLVTTLDPNIENKIRNATFLLQKQLEKFNSSIDGLKLPQYAMNSVFGDAFNNVLLAAGIFSDAYMLRYAVKKYKALNVETVKVPELTRSNARTNVLAGVDRTRLQRTKTFVTKTVPSVGGKVLAGATTVLTVYTSVQQILSVTTTLKVCQHIADNTRQVLNQFRPKKQESIDTLADTNGLKNNITREYNVLKSSLYSSNFHQFTQEIKKLALNASKQNSNYTKAAQGIDRFNAHIQGASFAQVEPLIDDLIGAFGLINHKLDCLTKKMNTINYASEQCRNGTGTFAAIFTNAQRQEVEDAKSCVDNGYMTFDQIRVYIDAKMDQFGKQRTCVRNNVLKKQLACSGWLADHTIQKIALDTSLSESDVRYFIDVSKCPLGTVNNLISQVICNSKHEDKTLQQILTTYSKYEPSQVTSTYNQCAVKADREKRICQDKADYYTLQEIFQRNHLYPQPNVKAVYDACVQKLEQGDINRICRAKRGGRPWPDYYSFYIEDFGEPAVKAVYDGCSSKDEHLATFKIWRF